MAYRVVSRRRQSATFEVSTAEASTATPAFQAALIAALKDSEVTDLILMDDSKTDLSRFVPWMLSAMGRP